jgi:hypothetical protein
MPTNPEPRAPFERDRPIDPAGSCGLPASRRHTAPEHTEETA